MILFGAAASLQFLVTGLHLLSIIPAIAAQTACNGHAEYCLRSYNNVSIIGAHDSYGVDPGNIAANQNYSVTTQLNNGIRLLQVQGHMNNGVLHLCHTLCALLDAGTFTAYLTQVHTWLVANPNEVVTLLLVNSDQIAASVWAASYVSAGLHTFSYTPPSVPVPSGAWPTLQTLITSGKRVVSFLAQSADVESAPYLIDEFTNIWETPYDETDQSFPCSVNRVTGSPVGKMYLINHFLDFNLTATVPVPFTAKLSETNAVSGYGSLSTQSNLCLSQHGYLPTFTLVDFYDVGNGSVFQYAAQLNSVTYVPVAIGNGSSKTAPSNSSTTGSTPGKSTSNGAHLRAMPGTVLTIISVAVMGMSVI